MSNVWRWTLIPALTIGAAAQVPEAAPDLAVGKKIFESQCALCHGESATGGRGPALTRPKLNKAPDEETLRSVISEGIAPEMPGAWQLHPHEVVSVAAYVRSLGSVPAEHLPGDAAHGERVYASKGCAGCHIVSGSGVGFGPELTDIGARRNAAFIRQTLLHPEATLPDGFEYVAAVTKRGGTVRGIRVNEDSFSIQLKDALGRFHSFRKSELSELRRLQHETPMPSFESALSSVELDDLVAYLAGLRGKP
jgi:cytochrome c oxidase cbb3-type subunit 3